MASSPSSPARPAGLSTSEGAADDLARKTVTPRPRGVEVVTSSPLNNRKSSSAGAAPPARPPVAADTASRDGDKISLAWKAGSGDDPHGPRGKKLRWDHGLEFVVVDDSAANR